MRLACRATRRPGPEPFRGRCRGSSLSGGTLHRAATLVHGLIPEHGEQEKGFVLPPPLLSDRRLGPVDRLAGIVVLRPWRGGHLRPQRALQLAKGVLRLAPCAVPSQEFFRADLVPGQIRDQPEVVREQLPIRKDHGHGQAPLATPILCLVLVLMKDCRIRNFATRLVGEGFRIIRLPPRLNDRSAPWGRGKPALLRAAARWAEPRRAREPVFCVLYSCAFAHACQVPGIRGIPCGTSPQDGESSRNPGRRK